MLAHFGMGLDDLHTVGAFHPVVFFQELFYGQAGLHLDLAVDGLVVADRIYAVKNVQVDQEFTGPFARSQVRTVVKDKGESRGKVVLRHTFFQVLGVYFFFTVAFVLFFDGRNINH